MSIETGSKVKVVLRRGRIIPCIACGRKYKCAMYASLSRSRARNSEWTGSTPILHNCNIYIPDKIPQDIKNPMPGRRHGAVIK